ncbi:hypothetical protein D2E71_26655 [Mycobacteroides abscessus]|uniref:Uncharacterized protein n=1 Tax=Mycobacteroides immunogenum TaxID=83262 RepID=A0ABR5LMG8_9MYCO|nr:hypothetical protein MAUC22_14750 [Mycobacteroides abscessus UC22]KPG28262.1 hypothetical protein AN912_22210 [Mycobacteroides immunogenum]PVA86325.1 hypothetical protein DDJ47_20185 [Mycobacteroides abscessus]KPG28825.1 hypothetical protein AN913_13170 [Mycobacteroides immunogenum]KPG60384.1 hypothetical protein AN918_12150 [Mycobacteroides immunogenum]
MSCQNVAFIELANQIGGGVGERDAVGFVHDDQFVAVDLLQWCFQVVTVRWLIQLRRCRIAPNVLHGRP